MVFLYYFLIFHFFIIAFPFKLHYNNQSEQKRFVVFVNIYQGSVTGMNYDAELRLVTDTFKKYGIQVTLADINRPPTRDLIIGKYLLRTRENSNAVPLRELIPPIAAQTVYTMAANRCCYIYFLLPDLQPEALMILGPYLMEHLTLNEILEEAELQGADPATHKDLEKYYSALPVLPRSSHLHLMLDAFFDRIWGVGGYTCEIIQGETIPDTTTYWTGSHVSDEESALLTASIMEERYNYENQLIEAVRQGQLRRVESFLSRVSPAVFEMRVSDPVRNLKNYCIITNTLLRKAAEQGGVHPVYIDRTSTGFALQIEQISSPSAGPALISDMAQSYCRLVRSHATKEYSPPIQNAILLIEGNLSGDLSLTRLARELNVNSSYLSTLFKKETGKTITDYITDRRISHARHLLDSTRLQVQTVGQHCGFEDVHYFSKVFKRLTGMTPKQYRQKTHN